MMRCSPGRHGLCGRTGQGARAIGSTETGEAMSDSDSVAGKPRMVGINHVAIEVGDVEEALGFLGAMFDVRLRGRGPGRAFVDMGDQFLALSEPGPSDPEAGRHFGLVVDEVAPVMEAADRLGATAGRNRFRDPWGNLFEIVAYSEIQFSKSAPVLRGMGLDLEKSDDARRQLEEKGLV
jgi:predicted enzyme related to lactoylglutathione lyase